jgi:curved DNA-binding protein CbpA
MQIAKDFYSVLDIPPGTSKEEIRQAYLRLARRYHPDVNDDPRSRERFEEINQAYTILSDDEARIFYNLYREGAEEGDGDLGAWNNNEYEQYEQDVPLAWWQRNTSTLGVGLAVTCVLAAYGLVLSMPNFQGGAYTRSSVTESERASRAVLSQDATKNLDKESKSEPSEFKKTPQATIQEPANTAMKAVTIPAPVGGQPVLSPKTEALATPFAKVADPLTLETPARAYEMLAYYALVVGDLNQFNSALDLAHRADPSFSKINSLVLSYQKLRSRKATLGNMLQSLRRQVIRENAARLTPSQLESLRQSVQNWQILEDS